MSEGVMEAAPASLPERPVRLREAREAAGLHIAAMAAALKVPVRKLEALEAGRYDELPDLTFARALASSACRQLKIDPAPVLEQIPQNPAPALGDRDNAINAPFKPASEAPAASPLVWLSRPALLGAIALLLAALVVLFLPQSASPPEPAPVATLPSAAPAAPIFQPGAPAAVEGAGPLAAPAADASAPGDSGGTTQAATASQGDAAPAPATSPATNATVAPSGTATAAAPDAPTASGTASAEGAVLRLQARQESWAEVTNGTGTVVLQRLLQPGERVEFSAAPPYSVLLGNAGEVQVTVRGRAFDAAAIARNNVARFEAR
jgi:cytoskeleton protein RodZ